MNQRPNVADAYIKRFQSLLDTSADEAERRMLERLIATERAKAEATEPNTQGADRATAALSRGRLMR